MTPVDPPHATSDYLPRRLDALVQRTRSSVSPWVQRALDNTNALPLRRVAQPIGVSTSATTNLLNRLESVVQRTTAFKMDIGSLGPSFVSRFSDEIIQRFAGFEGKYTIEQGDGGSQDPFPLAGYPGFGQAQNSQTSQPLQPAYIPSADRVPPPVQRMPARSPATTTSPATNRPTPPATPPAPPSAVRRKPDTPTTPPPVQTKRRLRSRIEEVPTPPPPSDSPQSTGTPPPSVQSVVQRQEDAPVNPTPEAKKVEEERGAESPPPPSPSSVTPANDIAEPPQTSPAVLPVQRQPASAFSEPALTPYSQASEVPLAPSTQAASEMPLARMPAPEADRDVSLPPTAPTVEPTAQPPQISRQPAEATRSTTSKPDDEPEPTQPEIKPDPSSPSSEAPRPTVQRAQAEAGTDPQRPDTIADRTAPVRRRAEPHAHPDDTEISSSTPSIASADTADSLPLVQRHVAEPISAADDLPATVDAASQPPPQTTVDAAPIQRSPATPPPVQASPELPTSEAPDSLSEFEAPQVKADTAPQTVQRALSDAAAVSLPGDTDDAPDLPVSRDAPPTDVQRQSAPDYSAEVTTPPTPETPSTSASSPTALPPETISTTPEAVTVQPVSKPGLLQTSRDTELPLAVPPQPVATEGTSTDAPASPPAPSTPPPPQTVQPQRQESVPLTPSSAPSPADADSPLTKPTPKHESSDLQRTIETPSATATPDTSDIETRTTPAPSVQRTEESVSQSADPPQPPVASEQPPATDQFQTDDVVNQLSPPDSVQRTEAGQSSSVPPDVSRSSDAAPLADIIPDASETAAQSETPSAVQRQPSPPSDTTTTQPPVGVSPTIPPRDFELTMPLVTPPDAETPALQTKPVTDAEPQAPDSPTIQRQSNAEGPSQTIAQGVPTSETPASTEPDAASSASETTEAVSSAPAPSADTVQRSIAPSPEALSPASVTDSTEGLVERPAVAPHPAEAEIVQPQREWTAADMPLVAGGDPAASTDQRQSGESPSQESPSAQSTGTSPALQRSPKAPSADPTLAPSPPSPSQTDDGVPGPTTPEKQSSAATTSPVPTADIATPPATPPLQRTVQADTPDNVVDPHIPPETAVQRLAEPTDASVDIGSKPHEVQTSTRGDDVADFIETAADSSERTIQRRPSDEADAERPSVAVDTAPSTAAYESLSLPLAAPTVPSPTDPAPDVQPAIAEAEPIAQPSSSVETPSTPHDVQRSPDAAPDSPDSSVTVTDSGLDLPVDSVKDIAKPAPPTSAETASEATPSIQREPLTMPGPDVPSSASEDEVDLQTAPRPKATPYPQMEDSVPATDISGSDSESMPLVQRSPQVPHDQVAGVSASDQPSQPGSDSITPATPPPTVSSQLPSVPVQRRAIETKRPEAPPSPVDESGPAARSTAPDAGDAGDTPTADIQPTRSSDAPITPPSTSTAAPEVALPPPTEAYSPTDTPQPRPVADVQPLQRHPDARLSPSDDTLAMPLHNPKQIRAVPDPGMPAAAASSSSPAASPPAAEITRRAETTSRAVQRSAAPQSSPPAQQPASQTKSLQDAFTRLEKRYETDIQAKRAKNPPATETDIFRRLEARYPVLRDTTKARKPGSDMVQRQDAQNDTDIFRRLEARYGSNLTVDPTDAPANLQAGGNLEHLIQRFSEQYGGAAEWFEHLGMSPDGADAPGEGIQRAPLPPSPGANQPAYRGASAYQPLDLLYRQPGPSSSPDETVIQRNPEDNPLMDEDQAETPVSQSVSEPITDPEDKETQNDFSPDLDALAVQIYPLIKRMIAVERERSRSRTYI